MPIAPDRFLVFVLTSLVFLIVPGPTIMMVVGQALAYGRRVALASVFGAALGNFLSASLSLFGMGALLAASPLAFDAMRWCAAAYLVHVGVKMWWAPARNLVSEENDVIRVIAAGRVFRDSLLVALLNPNCFVFFIGVMPQFISATRSFPSQAAFLVVVFVSMGMVNAYAYATVAAGARQMICRPVVLKAFTRTSAGFLIVTAFASVLARSAAI